MGRAYTVEGPHGEMTLVQGGDGVRLYAKRVEPQPENMPEGLVLIELPHNCYVDPFMGVEIEITEPQPTFCGCGAHLLDAYCCCKD